MFENYTTSRPSSFTEECNEDSIRKLLELGVDLNTTTDGGVTLLYIAVE
jgi:hypothetical protein